MEITPDLSEKIQELQILERSVQSYSMEKQTLQIEINEIANASSELTKTGNEVYKIIGGLMLKSDKNALLKELSDKKKVVELHIASIDKQLNQVESKSSALREEINAKISLKESK